MKPGIPLAWLQLTRSRSRLFVAIAGIAFAGFLMFMQLGFQAALYDSNTIMHRSLKADLILMSPQAQNISNMEGFPRRRLYQAMNFDGVVSAVPLYTERGNWRNPENKRQTEVLFFAFNPADPVADLQGISENLDKIKITDTMLFDRRSDGDYEGMFAALAEGKSLATEVQNRQVKLEGLFTLGASFAGDSNAIVSDLTFLRLFPGRTLSEVNVGLVTLNPETDSQQMAAALRAYLPGDVKVLTLPEFVEFEKDYWANSTPIGFIFTLGTAIGFLVGLVIVYQILFADVSDHLSEYATLKAIGFRDVYFLGVILQESLILAVLGFIPGLVISAGLYHVAAEATMLPIAMTVNRAILVLILTIVMCGVSGGIALRKLRSADPAEIF
ncbi:MAG: ABC transporter permease DevC [Synechococcaceae cyanobacterium]|jgi:putative ABC transport system permease protein